MTQTRYRETVDSWQTVEYLPVVKNHALVTLTPIKPSYREELWNSAVSGAKAAVMTACIIFGGILVIGLLSLL
jgi:hypothetical protein